MFAEIACWCKHDCCEIDTSPDIKIIFGDMRIFYICDLCDCHNPYPDWFDPWEL